MELNLLYYLLSILVIAYVFSLGLRWFLRRKHHNPTNKIYRIEIVLKEVRETNGNC